MNSFVSTLASEEICTPVGIVTDKNVVFISERDKNTVSQIRFG